MLPDKFDIHEWDIMRRFSQDQPVHLAEELLNAIHGKGAFRMFRAIIHNLGIADAWYQYREAELTRLAAACLEKEGVPFEAG